MQQDRSGALVIDILGLSLASHEAAILQDPRVSGVIFFARNFQSVAQIEHLVQEIRQVRSDIIIYVDQEGGRVQRFKQGLSILPSFRAISQHGLAAAQDMAWLMAHEILALGIDVSFTPVLDIDYGNNTIIADRSFGATADQVIAYAKAYIKGLSMAGMAATGKHFPGHGFVDGDSHLCLPIDNRALKTLEQADVRVFAELQHELQAMMTAHIHYNKCDDEIASYSSFWLKYLRQNLGFQGIVFSDDLVMQGAKISGGITSQAQKAMAAGCDLLLVCNDQQAVQELLNSAEPWYCTRSLAPLRGRLGCGFNNLLHDEAYQTIVAKWQQSFTGLKQAKGQ